MKKLTLFIFALMLCQVIFAALPPMSKSDLLALSTDKVYGQVIAQSSSEQEIRGGTEINYVSEVAVYVRDKAQNVEEGEVITVTHRRISRHMPGPVGQNINPREGDFGTFHLVIEEDGTYRVLEPNGFDDSHRHGCGELPNLSSEM